MVNKIKKLKKSYLIQSLSDVRTLGMLAFLAISLLVTWSSVRVVQNNYDLQKQISGMTQENDVQTLVNNNLKLKNQYYTTDAYLELAARRYYNKAAPGEKLIIVPKEIALKHSTNIEPPKNDQETLEAVVEANGSLYKRNFNAWLDFLFHRSDS